MVKKGVILLNLGGPDNLDAVRPFLYNLFSDREIIRLGPAFLQQPIALLISFLRAPKTREAYKMIGGGSPILRITSEQASALKRSLKEFGDIPVYVGMRYWHPFIEESLKKAFSEGVRKIIGLSLYPQYSKATTGSTKEQFLRTARSIGMETCFIDSWFDHPLFIKALADLILKKLNETATENTHLLFSAHSLPESFIQEGDPYVKEVEGTVRAVIQLLSRESSKLPPHSISYQSRSGPVKWIGPSTDERIHELAREGVRRIVVVPVSFVSDHIETLYEIDILYKELAEKEGVELYRVESLNTHPLFIAALKDLVLKTMDSG